jgi:hypothetical protein
MSAAFTDLLRGIPGLTLVVDGAAVGRALEETKASFTDDPNEALATSGATCLALGPTVHVTRGAVRKGAPRPAAWWAREDKLFLSFNVAAPPPLWVEVAANEAGVQSVLAGLSPREPAPMKVHRFFYGLLESVQTFMSIENQLTLSPYCEGLPLLLGSAAPADGRSDCFDDPEHVSTFETVLSKSRITISAIHTLMADASVATGMVEYQPAPHASVVAAWNAEHRCDYPLDLPLDVLATLDGGLGISLAQLEASVATAALMPNDLSLLVASTVITASGPGIAEPPELDALLRRHLVSENGDVRIAALSIAEMLGRSEVSADALESEQDPAVRAAMDERIAGASQR